MSINLVYFFVNLYDSQTIYKNDCGLGGKQATEIPQPEWNAKKETVDIRSVVRREKTGSE